VSSYTTAKRTWAATGFSLSPIAAQAGPIHRKATMTNVELPPIVRVPNYPLLIDCIATDEARLEYAKQTGDWTQRKAGLPTGRYVEYWECLQAMPEVATLEAALQWCDCMLSYDMESSERLARQAKERGTPDDFPDDFGAIVRDAYRLLRAVAADSYPDGFDEPSGEIRIADARNHLRKLHRWLAGQITDEKDDTIPAELRKWLNALPPDDGLREAYRRDGLFLIWNENEGGFGPVKIARRWNELPPEHRKLISPRLSGKVTDVVAKRGLAQAKKDRKTAQKKRSRKAR